MVCIALYTARICEFERLYRGFCGAVIQRLPPPPPPPPLPSPFSSFHCFISVTGAWNGGSWLGCGNLPAMGAVFLSRDWLATVEAPGYPRHPPSTQARQLLKQFAMLTKPMPNPTCFYILSQTSVVVLTRWLFSH